MKRLDDTKAQNDDANRSPRLLTINETSSVLRVSRWQVYALINRRQLKTIRIGRRRLVAEPDLAKLIQLLREEEAAR